MKKTIRAVLTAVVCLLLFSVLIFAFKGDLNNDGRIDGDDLRSLIGRIAADDGYDENSDFDSDSGITVLDAISLANAAANALSGPFVGDAKNASKITEDLENGTVTLRQKGLNSAAPSFTFFRSGAALSGASWAVTGKIEAQTVSGKSGHVLFIAERDGNNRASIFINRRVDGSNGIWRNILLNGTRTPSSGNQNVSNTLLDSTDWKAEFAFVFYGKTVTLYLKEPGETYESMTSYVTDWETCAALFAVNQYADVILSDLNMTEGDEKVKEIIDKVESGETGAEDGISVLFIGNSATYVNDIPQTLADLAGKAGFKVKTKALTKGGATLSDHADLSTDHGKAVFKEIEKGYDFVFLQENTSCISSEEARAQTAAAAKALDGAIRRSGATTVFYVRPPQGKTVYGFSPYEQCLEFDKLFVPLARDLGAENAYVDRAFAYAVKNLNVSLWGKDNAHTSPEGAYLAVCVFFSTLFDTSSTVLENGGLPDDVALSLQRAADKVVLENYVPD